MTLTALLTTSGIALGDLFQFHSDLLVATYLIAGTVVGMLSKYGLSISATGVQTIVAFAIGTNLDLPTSQIWRLCLATATGAGIQILATTILWSLESIPLEREALSNAYFSLSNFAASLTQNAPSNAPEPEYTSEFHKILLDPQPNLIRASRQYWVDQLGWLADQARYQLSAAAIGASYARLRHENTKYVHITHQLSAAFHLVGESLKWKKYRSEAMHALADQIDTQVREIEEMQEVLRGENTILAELCRTASDALACTQHLFHSDKQRSEITFGLRGLDAKMLLGISRTPPRRTTLQSPELRHAVHLGVGLALSEAGALALHLKDGYWAPMTVALVLRPEYAATFVRGMSRFAGTIIGLLVASVIVLFASDNPAMLITATVIIVWAGFATFKASYTIYSTSITVVIVLVYIIRGANLQATSLSRLIGTAIGGLVALTLARLLPTWEISYVPERLARALDTQADFVETLFSNTPRDTKNKKLAEALATARDARISATASVERMHQEPSPVEPIDPTLADSIVAELGKFALSLLALGAQMPLSEQETDSTNAGAKVSSSLRTAAENLRSLSDENHNLKRQTGSNTLDDIHERMKQSGDPEPKNTDSDEAGIGDQTLTSHVTRNLLSSSKRIQALTEALSFDGGK